MTDIPPRLFGSNPSWFCKNNTDLLNLFNKHLPLTNQASFRNGRVAATQKFRESCWKNWCSFVRTLGVEPWIQDAT